MDWYLYDNGHRHERVKQLNSLLSNQNSDVICLRLKLWDQILYYIGNFKINQKIIHGKLLIKITKYLHPELDDYSRVIFRSICPELPLKTISVKML